MGGSSEDSYPEFFKYIFVVFKLAILLSLPFLHLSFGLPAHLIIPLSFMLIYFFQMNYYSSSMGGSVDNSKKWMLIFGYILLLVGIPVDVSFSALSLIGALLTISYFFILRAFKISVARDTTDSDYILCSALWSTLSRYPIFLIYYLIYIDVFGDRGSSVTLSLFLFPYLVPIAYFGLRRAGYNTLFSLAIIRDDSLENSLSINRLTKFDVVLYNVYEQSINKFEQAISWIKSRTAVQWLSTHNAVARILRYEPEGSPSGVELFRLLKYIILVTGFAAIVHWIFYQLDIYSIMDVGQSTIEGLFVGFLVIVIFEAFFKGILPEGTNPPGALIIFLSLCFNIQTTIFYPDFEAIWVAAAFQILIAILYIVYVTGLRYGHNLVLLGLSCILFSGAVSGLGAFLESQGILLGLYSYISMSFLFLFMYFSLLLTGYGVYLIFEKKFPAFWMLWVGGSTWVFARIMFPYTFHHAHYFGYVDLSYLHYYINYGFLMLGNLILFYGVYLLWKSIGNTISNRNNSATQ